VAVSRRVATGAALTAVTPATGTAAAAGAAGAAGGLVIRGWGVGVLDDGASVREVFVLELLGMAERVLIDDGLGFGRGALTLALLAEIACSNMLSRACSSCGDSPFCATAGVPESGVPKGVAASSLSVS